jgi:hypothetical protein
VVEGTPLLREHTPKKCIEGSNPSLSAIGFDVLYGRTGVWACPLSWPRTGVGTKPARVDRTCEASAASGLPLPDPFFERLYRMSRFDEDTSIMRMRMDATLIELRKRELPPQSKARGILTGALLGACAWIAIVALCVEAWRLFN